MRRWNGWGDDTINYPLSSHALEFLRALVGPGRPLQDATLPQTTANVPASRLPDHALVSFDPLERLRHARGQSLPDWIALRSGRIPAFPDGVAYPLTEEHLVELLRYAASAEAGVIPYGGGTSVVGHINPEPDAPPTLTVSLRRMNRLRRFDAVSRLAAFDAGVAGPELEAQLRARGFTLGHFPQSFEYSTLGGWVAARSCGQQSLYYGRIEQLFAGGTLIAPAGKVILPAFPASAAGPDLRQIALGSEGRMGILSEVVVRVTTLPEREEFHAVFFPTFEQGVEAAREMVQAGLPLSMLRLSTTEETRTTLALAGHERLIGMLETLLSIRSVGEDKSMLLCGFTGDAESIRRTRHATLELAKTHGGVHVGRRFGRQWIEGRFRTPYLRNTLWEQGYAVDTLETATNWPDIAPMIERIERSLRAALHGMAEKVHVFTHLSHMYPQGASVYTTYLFRLGADPDETLHRWQLCKESASRAIVEGGGTISHQHGVGVDHAAYLSAEKGALGINALQRVFAGFDPGNIMNPGKLIAGEQGG